MALWQLAGLAQTDAPRVRAIIATFLAAFAANAVLAALFFFAVPLVLAIAIAAALGLAFVASGREGARHEARR